MGWPIKKWPGVSTSNSFMSFESGNKGHGFRIFMIWITRVSKSSRVILLFATVLCKWCLEDFTFVTQRPPKLGDYGGINFHVMNSSAKKFDTSLLGVLNNFLKLFNSFGAPLQLMVLSKVSVSTLLLLAQNLLTVSMNAAADKSLTISWWMTFVDMHMSHRHIMTSPHKLLKKLIFSDFCRFLGGRIT